MNLPIQEGGIIINGYLGNTVHLNAEVVRRDCDEAIGGFLRFRSRETDLQAVRPFSHFMGIVSSFQRPKSGYPPLVNSSPHNLRATRIRTVRRSFRLAGEDIPSPVLGSHNHRLFEDYCG